MTSPPDLFAGAGSRDAGTASGDPLTAPQRDVYTVSRLNAEVRTVLEGSFPLLWVGGEISNLATPASGHAYFSLKDAHAQVRCAMFRAKRQLLRFRPENGQQVLLRARISLYEGRGEFQIIVEHMEPAGEGALRLAFEHLKQKLAAEGLFDAAAKAPLPTFPRQVGVITSPTGAAVRDVLSVLKRRFPGLPVVIYPVQVQGEQSAAQICRALALANERAECDVLILTRGGGSLEDLQSFNDEGVARAVFASRIPVVAGVGHEVDFSIADFVADRRAPTPSAAAEMVSPDRAEWQAHVRGRSRRLTTALGRMLDRTRQHLGALEKRLHLVHPGRRLQQQAQRLDDLERRMRLAQAVELARGRNSLQRLESRLYAQSPARRVEMLRMRLESLSHRFSRGISISLRQRRERLAAATAQLDAVSPLSTLQRGYAIARRLPEGDVVTDAARLSPGDELELRLAKGRVLTRVDSTDPAD